MEDERGYPAGVAESVLKVGGEVELDAARAFKHQRIVSCHGD